MASVAKDVVLSLGLISTTVRIENAKESTDSTLKTVCCGQGQEHAPMAISSVYTCATCGPVQDRTLLKKAKRIGDAYAVVEADEIVAIRDETASKYKKSISLTAHRADQVQALTAPGGKCYYLVPASGDTRYTTLVELVRNHPELTFCALWTARTRSSMFALRASGDALVLQELTRAEALREVPTISTQSDEALTGMAEQMLLLPGVVQDFDPATYRDSYEDRIASLVSSREAVAAGDVTPDTKPSAPAVGNAELLEQLQQLIDQEARA